MTSVWPKATKYVILNSLEYRATIKTAITHENEVQQYPVESGFPITDNIKRNTPKFELEITLGLSLRNTSGDWQGGRITEYEELKALQDGEPFVLNCVWGYFPDMVISSLSPVMELSMNTFSCTVSLMQIKIATLLTKEFIVNDIDGKTIYKSADPTNPALEAAIVAIETPPVVKEPEKTWYETIIGWIW